MSEWGYVGVSYALTWIVLGGYALHLRNRMRRARQELAEVPA